MSKCGISAGIREIPGRADASNLLLCRVKLHGTSILEASSLDTAVAACTVDLRIPIDRMSLRRRLPRRKVVLTMRIQRTDCHGW